ncbi:Tat pathway signal protein [Paenibacillus chitinolyticus]|uniref:Tat pathway signal protein n=1 Tax=Paenibacillus chitinolyticus TaxID=79263 RepID=UPI001C44FFFA|nr:Tat pathway signal protein [Paenibacillus chitinolyticus]MBV6712222.1 Tat pathway signal protein [Paenibacillus chitinolyticus]
MKKREEREWFGLLDEITADLAENHIPDLDTAEFPLEKDPDRLTAIKQRTFEKIVVISPGTKTKTAICPSSGGELAPAVSPVRRTGTSRPKLLRRYALLAALAALLLTGGVLAGAQPEVAAQMRRVLQYMPGFAGVADSEKTEQRVEYVQPLPTTHKIGKGQLEIRGLSIGEKNSTVTLVGTGLPRASEVTLRNGLGEKYVFRRATLTGAEGGWTGIYGYEGRIEVTGNTTLIAEGRELSLKLVAPREVEQVADLGPTAEHSGIRLTAVSAAVDDRKMKLTILPQLPGEVKINSYGFNSFYKEIPSAKLFNPGTGEEIPFTQDETFPNPSEIYWERGKESEGGAKLVIPALVLTRSYDQPAVIRLPVPERGSVEVNRTFDLFGFPVKVSRVERILKGAKIDGDGEAGEDSIRIWFELHGNEQAAETLYEFPPSLLNGGAVWHRNEQTDRMEWMLLSVQPGQKEYELKVSSLNSQVRGPWEFSVDQP